MTTVSAIIPAYNGVSRYLDHAIRSVLAQTHRDLELIVVDDASTDDTARLVLRYPKARYFRRAVNGRQAAARNDGARLARGEYLAFLDQDDLWDPMFLELTVPLLEANPKAALVHCDGYKVSGQNEILEYDAAMKYTDSITQMLRGGHDVGTAGSLFRKACFDAVVGYDDRLTIWEDIDLAIRLYAHYPFLHLPRPLYRHRLYAHNASRDIPSGQALAARLHFLEKHGPSCRAGTPEALALTKDWACYYGDLGKLRLAEGRLAESRAAFWQAVRREPFNRRSLLRLIRSYLPLVHSSRPASNGPWS